MSVCNSFSDGGLRLEVAQRTNAPLFRILNANDGSLDGIGRARVEHAYPLSPAASALNTGFARPSSNEFKDYVAKIERLSDQFAPPTRSGQKSYKAFQPSGYKWDKAG